MDQEVRDKWIAALRSGEYTQANSELRFEDSKEMCCLGVLCDIMDPDGWNPAGAVYKRHKLAQPTEEFIEPMLGLSGQQIMLLANMNDDNESFDTIADYIEENL